MTLQFEERLSDSPFVEQIWRTQSEQESQFISLAATQWEMVITTYQGETTFIVRGPETQATPAYCPSDAEFFGIVFKVGTLMPHLPVQQLVDGGINLTAGRNVWLQGETWQLPTYDNADTFVNRLVQQELIVQEPLVEAVLQNRPTDLSSRSIERRFLKATGLTQGRVLQIERARNAAYLLQQGIPILDVVERMGYADQPHLTRSVKRFVGQTPAQLIGKSTSSEQLSFLFESIPFFTR